MKRKRVLWVGENSRGTTGYCTYSHEILSRLHALDRYDIAELGLFGLSHDDPRFKTIPWKFYSNLPTNPHEEEQYRSSPTCAWGEFRFEDVLLDFRPDVCLNIMDFWNWEFMTRSPLRRFYRLGLMPSWDSSPVHDQWVASTASADALLSYSQWAVGEMQKQFSTPIMGVSPAGVDEKVFHVKSKKRCRSLLGIGPDDLVVGFVGRNQGRKLFPDLLEAFAILRQSAPEGIKERLKLYLHTAYPDVGWDLPRFMKNLGIGSSVYFTYVCRDCGATRAHVWQDARAVCPHCGGWVSTINSDLGVEREVLAAIYNSLDSYVQYSTCGAQEIPVVEASACGVKCFVVNYSAMEDFPRTIDAEPIRVQRFFWDGPTHTRRALPDNADCARKLLDWLLKPESVRLAEGAKISSLTLNHYTWQKSVESWVKLIDSLSAADPWDGPVQIHRPQKLPPDMPAWDLVTEGLRHVAGRPDLIGTYFHLRMVRDLERGVSTPHTGMYNFTEATGMNEMLTFHPYGREQCERDLVNLGRLKNTWEKRRGEALKLH